MKNTSVTSDRTGAVTKFTPIISCEDEKLLLKISPQTYPLK
jgi:hypothetical protein